VYRWTSIASPLAVSYLRVRSFSIARITIQSSSPSSILPSFAGSIRRRAAIALSESARVRNLVLGRSGSTSRMIRCIFGVRLASQFFRIKRRRSHQQLVKQYAQRIDIRAGVDVDSRHFRLLGAHVLRRADHLAELGEGSFSDKC